MAHSQEITRAPPEEAVLGRASSSATSSVAGPVRNSYHTGSSKDVAREGHALSGWGVRQSGLPRHCSALPTMKQRATEFQSLGMEDSPLSIHDAWETALLQTLGGAGEPHSASNAETARYNQNGRGKWLWGASAGESEDTGVLAKSQSDEGAQDRKLQAWLDDLAADPHRLRCSASEASSGGWLLRKSRPQAWYADFPELMQPPPPLDSTVPDHKVSLLVAEIEAEIKAQGEAQPHVLYRSSEAGTVVDLFAADGVPAASPEVRNHCSSVHCTCSRAHQTFSCRWHLES